ncbi:MAG: SDR family oxidoreductase [Bauldia litoralis]
MTLDGEIALVTGASRGIGAEIARARGRAGAAVTVTARQQAAAETVADGIVADGGKAIALACVVGDLASIATAGAEVTKRLGAPTILINNAGVIDPLGDFHAIDIADWSTNLTVNLTGPAVAAQAVLPAMLAAGRGTIVNISSGVAQFPVAGWGAYCVAKAGLMMLGQVLDAEYGDRGIRVFGLAPGLVDTDMQGTIRAAGVGPTAGMTRVQLTPPEEPANAVVFLCGSGGDAFTGLELDLRDADFRAALGLDPSGG